MIQKYTLLVIGCLAVCICSTLKADTNVANTTVNVGPGGHFVTAGSLTFQNAGAIDNSGTVKVSGNWTNNGTGLVNATPGTVEFNGASSQTIGGNTITDFYDVNINNAAGVTLATNANVGHTLTFINNNAKIITGANAVTITSNPPLPIVGAGTNSYVDGNLAVQYAAGSSVTYNYEIGGGVYAPASLAINGVTTSGSVTGSTATGDAPAESSYTSGIDANNRVNQHWIFNNSNTIFSDYNITFEFTNTFYTGNSANYEIRKFDPNAWALTTSAVTGTTIQATGLTSFSEFAVGIGGCIPPGSSGTVSNPSCSGASNGSITLTVSGGTPPYTFQWSSGQNTQNVSGLSAGSYSVTITGNNSCSTTRSFTLSDPATLSLSCNGTNVQCSGNSSGSASVAVTGGTLPYSYLWNNGATVSSISNLAAGTYTVTVTDQCGSATCSYTVTQPSALSTICSGTNISCNGAGNGTASVAVSGGTVGYSYLWSNGAAASSINNLSQGTYSVTVTDANTCSSSCSYTVNEPALLIVSASSNTPVCEGSNLTLSSIVSGGTAGFSYSWTGPNFYTSPNANPVISNTSSANAGSYSVTVTDAGNCTATNFTSVTTTLCNATLNLNLFVQGYYSSGGLMRPVLFNEGVTTNNTLTDTVTVELRDASNPNVTIETAKTLLATNGSASAIFNSSVIGGTYWITIKHRNIIQTWSSATVQFATVTNYDFTDNITKAYGNTQVQVSVSPPYWAFYNGNNIQDLNIDLIDFPPLDLGINSGLFGYYAADLNGDGNVDLLDFPVLDGNINAGIFSHRP